MVPRCRNHSQSSDCFPSEPIPCSPVFGTKGNNTHVAENGTYGNKQGTTHGSFGGIYAHQCGIVSEEVESPYQDRPARGAAADASSQSVESLLEDNSVCDTVNELEFDSWINTFPPRLKIPVSASIYPPTTASTLSELEYAQMIDNPRLRHDINFDSELHFRPNLDGTKGQEKQMQAEKYWHALEAELEFYAFLLGDTNATPFKWSKEWTKHFRISQQRIPVMFATVKDILRALMPDRDQERVNEALDVRLIMQQIERGVFDLAGLCRWLALLLKAHCAPMRDPWVDKMVEQTTKAAETFDAHLIVTGLREIFGILEAMKLDVANHQIRHLRPMLLENTIDFEQKYYNRKINKGYINVKAALSWLDHCPHEGRSSFKLPKPPTSSENIIPCRFTLFITALISSVLPTSSNDFPETFKLDASRLTGIRSDIHNTIFTSICITGLELLMRDVSNSSHHNETTTNGFPDFVHAIVGSNVSEARWAFKVPNIAAEIVRGALSGCMATGSTADMGSLSEAVEEWLMRNLRISSELFTTTASTLGQILFEQVLQMTKTHLLLTPTEIFKSLVSSQSTHQRTGLFSNQPTGNSSKLHRSGRTAVGGLQERRIEDIVRRVTNIAVLHWRVWAPLLYEREDAARHAGPFQ